MVKMDYPIGWESAAVAYRRSLMGDMSEKDYREKQQAWLNRVLAEPPLTLTTYYDRMEATHPDYRRPLPKGRKPNKKDARIAELEAEVKRLKARLRECAL
jgi:hypothetical protein